MLDLEKRQQQSRLGSILVERHYITVQQLEQALAYQVSRSLRLGEALLALNLITPTQLKRALRRQSWVRGVTATVALILAPLSPAFAASQGTTSTSSSASSEISVTILPKSLLNGNQSIRIESHNSEQTSDSLCHANLTSHYHVKAAGSGEQGAFELRTSTDETVHYRVAFQHQQQAFEALEVNQSSSSYQTSWSSKQRCDQFDSSRIKIALDTPSLETNQNDGIYTGVLTLTIAAE